MIVVLVNVLKGQVILIRLIFKPIIVPIVKTVLYVPVDIAFV